MTKAQLQARVAELEEDQASFYRDWKELRQEKAAVQQELARVKEDLARKQAHIDAEPARVDRYARKIAELEKDLQQLHTAHSNTLRDWHKCSSELTAANRNYSYRVNLLELELQRLRLSPEDIRDLLRLCHPDVHKNSELATRMTKRLLDIRK